MKTEEVQRIEICSRQIGRGKQQQLTLHSNPGGFGEIGLGLVQEFLDQVSKAPVPGSQRPSFSPNHPYLEVRIVLWSGDEICLKSRSNRSHMLPFFQNGSENYNRQLSRSLAALIPKGFLNRTKLTKNWPQTRTRSRQSPLA